MLLRILVNRLGPPARERSSRAARSYSCYGAKSKPLASFPVPFRIFCGRGLGTGKSRACRSFGDPVAVPAPPNGIPRCRRQIPPSFRINTIWLRFGFDLASFWLRFGIAVLSPNRSRVPQASPTSRLDTTTPKEYIQLSKSQLLCP